MRLYALTGYSPLQESMKNWGWGYDVGCHSNDLDFHSIVGCYSNVGCYTNDVDYQGNAVGCHSNNVDCRLA